MDDLLSQMRQAEQNFNYADQDYIDAAIHEMNAVNEKFRDMLMLNGNIENISEEQLHQDAIETVEGILEDDPDWLDEEW